MHVRHFTELTQLTNMSLREMLKDRTPTCPLLCGWVIIIIHN